MRHFTEPIDLTGADGRHLVISPMLETDIELLASIYRKVWIHREKYRRVLNPLEPHSFEREGGMFLIQDAASLFRLLEDPSEYVWVVHGEGRLMGALWCGLTDEKYCDPSCITPFSGFEDLPGRIERGLSDRTLYFSKEILVAPEARGMSLPVVLLDAAMRFFYAHGYQQSLGEVYYVHALRDGEGERAVDLFNNTSFRTLERTGCRMEGEFPPCTVHADGFDVVLSKRIVGWDLSFSLQKTEPALAAAGMVRRHVYEAYSGAIQR